MMGLGEAIFVMAIMAMFASPIERTLAHRKWVQEATYEAQWRTAFPFQTPDAALDDLVRRAEEALRQDFLARGIAAVSAIYDASAERNRPPPTA